MRLATGAGDALFGVLALQGDFAAHLAAFRDARRDGAGGAARGRARPASPGFIPGGESTTLLNLMGDEPWFDAVRDIARGGGPVVAGTCAGAILLAREVRPPSRASGLLDAVVERNAWGRQVDSFEAALGRSRARSGRIDGVFIRAPRFRSLLPGVEVLARHCGEPVLVRQGCVVAATFHPELTRSRALHRYLSALATDESPGTGAPAAATRPPRANGRPAAGT
jgi:pyridoxal 5'-phosphate synthase pdxT subunit